MKSLNGNHSVDENEQLLPCCGFNFWKIENGLLFGNCGTGINWDIYHINNKIVHKFKNIKIETDFEEWREAVVNFSYKVSDFYDKSSPRKFSDDESEKEFKYFMSDFRRLRAKAFD